MDMHPARHGFTSMLTRLLLRVADDRSGVLVLQLPLGGAVRRLRLERLNVPDTLRVFVNAAVGAEETHAGDALDRLADPLLLVLVSLVNERVRLDVAVEVVRDEVVVAVVADGRDEGGKVRRVAESALLDLGEDLGEVWVDVVRAVGVRVTEIFNVLGEVAEEEDVVLANLAGDFNLGNVSSCTVICSKPAGGRRTLAPSQVPIMRPPLRTNFMLLVPEASVPAVEMCSLISEAGVMISALLTL